MDMKKFIELGAEKAGSNKALAKVLNQSESMLSDVKAGKKGLNAAICIKLADYIEEDRLKVIAASNLITEKDEEKRKIFESCLKKSSKAASIAMIIGATALVVPSSNNTSETNTYKVSNAKHFILC